MSHTHRWVVEGSRRLLGWQGAGLSGKDGVINTSLQSFHVSCPEHIPAKCNPSSVHPKIQAKSQIQEADLEKLRTPPDCSLMLRLGAACWKPRAPPSLWVVAVFLVTVALLLTSFRYCFIQSLVEVSREKEKQVPSTRGLAVTIPLSAAGGPFANKATLVLRGNSCFF